MYVCSCNRLTDVQVAEAARAGAGCPDDIYAACGCARRCGRCAVTMLRMLDAEGAAGFCGQPEAATV
jgi:bacterioferritin-associated ferredoxin